MATNEEIVAAAQQLYVSYYGRPADPAGLAYWIAEFTLTDNVDQALVDFGTSVEYLAWIADNDLNDSESLVTALFNQMFNRDPDAEGLAFYVIQLESGQSSLTSIALDVANGATGDDRTILDNKIEVANGFTEDVLVNDKFYSESNIADAQDALALVDVSDASKIAGAQAGEAVVDSMPTQGGGGFFTPGSLLSSPGRFDQGGDSVQESHGDLRRRD